MSFTSKHNAVARWGHWLLAAGFVVAGVGLAGCGDDDDDSDAGGTETTAPSDDEGTASGEAVPYTVAGFEYTDIEAPAGGTIEIENTSDASHTFTADDTAFDVSFGAGETATVDVPTEPGEYPFHCNNHASMTATLVVS